MALNSGTKLGPYEIQAPLGAGGMGEVYRARDTRLDRDVALKILHSEVAGDPDRRARFEREAKTVAALSHPNIVALYEVGSADGIAYTVSELVEGEPLREQMRQGNIRCGRWWSWPRCWPTAWPLRMRRALCIATSSRRT
jgi:eukaryotic-like serine/threonine-protein kinase